MARVGLAGDWAMTDCGHLRGEGRGGAVAMKGGRSMGLGKKGRGGRKKVEGHGRGWRRGHYLSTMRGSEGTSSITSGREEGGKYCVLT